MTDQRTDGTVGTSVFKSLCLKKQSVKRKAAAGRGVRYSSGLPEGSRSDSPQQGVSATSPEDSGIFAGERGSLPDEAYPYVRGISKCKDDREGAALK